MPVTSLTRFSGGNRDAFVATAKKAKMMFENAGGEFKVGQIYSGPVVGQWVAMITFADWEAYGTAMKLLSGNSDYLKMMAELAAVNPAVDRTFIVGIDL